MYCVPWKMYIVYMTEFKIKILITYFFVVVSNVDTIYMDHEDIC